MYNATSVHSVTEKKKKKSYVHTLVGVEFVGHSFVPILFLYFYLIFFLVHRWKPQDVGGSYEPVVGGGLVSSIKDTCSLFESGKYVCPLVRLLLISALC